MPILKTKIPRLLVVGGTGRLGPLLRRAWQDGEAGAAAVWQARREDAFPGQGGPDLVFDPLRDAEAFAAAARASDVVLNLAGVTAGAPEALALNTPLAQAALAAAGGRPVLLASSAAVYGPGEALREEDPCAPQTPYGAAKTVMEQAVGQAERSGAVVLLRIGNVAGADALLGRAAPAGGRLLDILPDGKGPRRSFIGPRALARALARLAALAAAGAELPEVLNLALPGTCAMDDLLAAAGEAWIPRPAPPGVLPLVGMDVGRAERLGLVPEAPVRAAGIVADLRSVTGMAG